MKNCVYEISNLGKKYSAEGTWAIQGVNLQIFEGEIFGLLGDNGAGKSTLVKQMVGLIQPTSGEVHLFKQNIVDHMAMISLNVGYMPQKTNTLNQMTVSEALYYTAHLRGLSRRDARAEVKNLLMLWQMEGLEEANNTHLSGGQRRLLRLAVAMAGWPPILILDEPANDLDPVRRNLVWDVLRKLNREAGSINLIVTFLMLAIGPVLFPPSRLPGLIITLGRLSPATYAASALRQGLVGEITSQIWVDLIVLSIASIGMLALVGRWLDWRER